MFKKSRRKIVAAIMLVLVLLLGGTFCIIYMASYREMTEENKGLLNHYVETYVYSEGKNSMEPGIQGERGEKGEPRGKPPMLELSTFYSVVFSQEGQLLAVDNADTMKDRSSLFLMQAMS